MFPITTGVSLHQFQTYINQLDQVLVGVAEFGNALRGIWVQGKRSQH